MNVNVACILLVFLYLNQVCCHGLNKHMVCKDIGDIFTEEGDDGKTVEKYRGPQGPKGNRGYTGAKGNPGPPGVVNYSMVEEIIESKMAAVILQLQDKIDMLERQIAGENATTPSPRTPERLKDQEIQCSKGLIHNGKCYVAIVPGNAVVTYEEAQVICAAVDGNLADITSPDVQKVIEQHLREKIPKSREFNDFWLGMTYDPVIDQLQLSTGQAISTLKWFPGYPLRDPSRVVVGIEVKRNQSDEKQGIFNPTLASSLYGTLCEK